MALVDLDIVFPQFNRGPLSQARRRNKGRSLFFLTDDQLDPIQRSVQHLPPAFRFPLLRAVPAESISKLVERPFDRGLSREKIQSREYFGRAHILTVAAVKSIL